jgi:hypothetical protein
MLDYVGIGISGGLIATATTLFMVNIAATFDFLSWAKVGVHSRVSVLALQLCVTGASSLHRGKFCNVQIQATLYGLVMVCSQSVTPVHRP